jgi:outer membrane protein assembly factor BamB
MTRPARTAGLLAGLLLLTPAAPAADWPQWMGPNRDDVWPETGIVRALPPGGPKVLWRVPVGGGYAGPAVANGKVYVTDKQLKPGAAEQTDPFDTKKQVPTTERVLCLDAKTGHQLWKHEYNCTYQVSYAAGPRCTPTVSGGKVYTLGTMGDLFCLDADSGKVVWSKNFPKDYAAKVPMWGYSGHPLVYKNLLVCLVGGENALVVAFDKDTGKEAWKALPTPEPPAGPGYSPPTLIHAGGTDQLVIYHSRGLTALNPTTGQEHWKVALPAYMGMAIMAPRKEGDLLFAGGVFDRAVVVRLDKDKPGAGVVWVEGQPKGDAKEEPKKAARPTRGLYPVNMTPFVEGGVIYGVDQPGMLRAVDLKTGKHLWATFKPVVGEEKDEDFKGAGSGTAFLVKNGDRFFIFAETGDLVIAKLSPQKYEEVSRAHLLERTGAAFGRKVVWSHPAFADKCVFARNDKEIVCASLAAE